jgi:Xaa-Pro aminopeptidase
MKTYAKDYVSIAQQFFTAYDTHDVDGMLALCADGALGRYAPHGRESVVPIRGGIDVIWRAFPNAVFPRPFTSLARYDHLDQNMRAGDLVRLDVGCEQDHYIGDLGRTVPVSGHYDDGQRETWNIFVAAYHSGVLALRDGVTVDQIFDAWSAELLRHRASAKTVLARHAIDSWSDRKNAPFWQVHTTNLMAGRPVGPLRLGTTINFEPIVSVDGQGFFLEDMYLITKDGSDLLTPGVPYSAEDIEAAMR